MCFRILLTILVISAYSQTNAKTLDAHDIVERLVKISDSLCYLHQRIQTSVKMNLTVTTINNSLELANKTCNSSTQAEINKIIKELRYCKPLPLMAFTSNPTSLDTTPEDDNRTGIELWNQPNIATNVLRKLFTEHTNKSEDEFELEINSINSTIHLVCKDLQQLRNKLWYGILMMNLLDIRCYSEGETLEKLWFKIPQPPATSEFGYLNLTELWFNQILPSIPSDEPSEPFADPKCETQSIKDVWDKLHYQMLFRRILQIKYLSNGKDPQQWNKLTSRIHHKRKDRKVTTLWNQLTLLKLTMENADIALMSLSFLLYNPLEPVLGPWLQLNM